MKKNCNIGLKNIKFSNKTSNLSFKIEFSTKKLFLILLSLLINTNSFAQSKKEQIIILTTRLDSLVQVINLRNTVIDENLKTINKLEQKTIENDLTHSKLQKELFQLKLNFDSILNIIDSNKIEIQAKNNQILSLKSHEFKSPSLIYDCKGALGNSSSYYPFRTNGEINGCIVETCEEIPSDIELHATILNIKKDFNNDGIIDVSDLEPAIKEIGDINEDGRKDIYDINYPNKIKYAKTTINPRLIKDDQITSII